MQRAGWHAAAMTARVTDIDQRATRLYKETLYENHEFDKYLVFGLTTQRSKQLHRSIACITLFPLRDPTPKLFMSTPWKL